MSISFLTIISVQVRIFPLNMRDIIIYVARWWEKYLSKRSLIKHTCSWRDKLIALWTLNRLAKMLLRIAFFIIFKEPSVAQNCLRLESPSLRQYHAWIFTWSGNFWGFFSIGLEINLFHDHVHKSHVVKNYAIRINKMTEGDHFLRGGTLGFYLN